MKIVHLILGAALALLLSACATQKDFYNFQGEVLKQTVVLAAKDKDLAIERERTRQKQYDALIAMKDKMDAGGTAAFAVSANIGTFAGGGGAGSGGGDAVGSMLAGLANQKPPESTEDKAFKWASLILGGGRLVVDRLNSRDQVNATRDTQLGLYSMIAQINRDTGQAVVGGVQATGSAVAPFASTGPQNQYTIDISNSNGVGLLGGTGSWTTSSSINCSSGAGAQGGAAAGGGTGGAVAGATGGQGGSGGPGGSSGTVPCTVSH